MYYCGLQRSRSQKGCNEIGYEQCAACKTDYRYGFDMDMQPISGNYPVPALADTATVLTLSHAGMQDWQRLAWDGIWREDLPVHVR